MRVAALLVAVLFLIAPLAAGAGHYIKINVTAPEDGAIFTTNTTTLSFTLDADISSELSVSVNDDCVLSETVPPGTHHYDVEIELHLGYNGVYVVATNKSAGQGDIVFLELWYKGESGLPVLIELDPQYVRPRLGETITFKGTLHGFVVWDPPVLTVLPNRTMEVYIKPVSQLQGYGERIDVITTDQFGDFSYSYTFAEAGNYEMTFRFPGDELYAPGIMRARIYVNSTTESGGGSGGGSSGHAPARGVWIVKPRDGDVLSGTVMVEAISTEGAPRLYLDSEDLGEMAPTVFAEHYYAIIDTTQFPDGEHEIRAVAGAYDDSAVVEFSNAPSGDGRVKVEIIAPGDDSVVPPAFRLVFAVAWEGVPEPTATVYVDGSPLPGLDVRSATPPRFSNNSEHGEKRCVVQMVLDPGDHEITVEASSENDTATDSITVHVSNETRARTGSRAYVTANGWIVRTPPDAVAVYLDTGNGIVFGEQRGVGRWFVPAPSSFCVFEASPANITVVYADGTEEGVTPSFSLSGAVDWLREEHSVPTWVFFLIFFAVAVALAWRWLR